MPEYDIYFTAQAEQNYKDICAYLQNRLKSEQAKNNFIVALDGKMGTLRKSPFIFQLCEYQPLFIRNIRYALVNQYKVYYQIDDVARRVNILYIKHGLQNEQTLIH